MSAELVPSNGAARAVAVAVPPQDEMAGATLSALLGFSRKLEQRIVEVRGLVESAAVAPAPRPTPPPATVVSRTPLRQRMNEIVD